MTVIFVGMGVAFHRWMRRLPLLHASAAGRLVAGSPGRPHATRRVDLRSAPSGRIIEHMFEAREADMMRTMTGTVCVWTEGRVPVRFTWNGQRFTVTDTPTPLRDRIVAPELTHPLEPQYGWRFQGTNDRSESFVFDVRIGVGQAWELVAVYD
jgi:hypothetical protein